MKFPCTADHVVGGYL